MMRIPVEYGASSDAILHLFPYLHHRQMATLQDMVGLQGARGTLIASNSTSNRISERETEPTAAAVRDRIHEAYQNANEPGWDGYGAAAVNADTLQWALRFATAVSSLSSPDEIGVDPDGEISFDWRDGQGRVFSVSVGSDGILSYAGILGEQRIHGADRLQDGPPSTIAGVLTRLHTNTSQ